MTAVDCRNRMAEYDRWLAEWVHLRDLLLAEANELDKDIADLQQQRLTIERQYYLTRRKSVA